MNMTRRELDHIAQQICHDMGQPADEAILPIDAPPGTRVCVTAWSAQQGGDYDRELITQHLVIGQVYTIRLLDMDSWHTDVYLEGFPDDVAFNSVNFTLRGPHDGTD